MIQEDCSSKTAMVEPGHLKGGAVAACTAIEPRVTLQEQEQGAITRTVVSLRQRVDAAAVRSANLRAALGAEQLEPISVVAAHPMHTVRLACRSVHIDVFKQINYTGMHICRSSTSNKHLAQPKRVSPII